MACILWGKMLDLVWAESGVDVCVECGLPAIAFSPYLSLGPNLAKWSITRKSKSNYSSTKSFCEIDDGKGLYMTLKYKSMLC